MQASYSEMPEAKTRDASFMQRLFMQKPSTVQDEPLSCKQRQYSSFQQSAPFFDSKQDKGADITFADASHYLKSVSTQVNCETDAHLYSIDKATSNEYMGVIGVKILCPNL